MASLLDLSAELKLNIIEHLDLTWSRSKESFIYAPPADLLSLSLVCRVFRTICEPFLLQNLTLLNTAKSGDRVLSILQSAQASHVRGVHYIGIKALPERAWCNDHSKLPPSPEDLPEIVSHVLSNLGKLHKLERVIVQFAFDGVVSKDEAIFSSLFELFERLTPDIELPKAEETGSHRSLMARSYRALSLNAPSSIRHLELENVTPFACSVWDALAFRTILQNLTSFTISLRGGDNGFGYCIIMQESYHDFISQLPLYFLQHLIKVRHFNFAASAEGPPGGINMNTAGLPFLPEHLPLLETLSLSHIIISPDLAVFVSGHASTLRSISLTHCYSVSEDNLRWCDLFHPIREARMPALQVFDVGPSDIESVRPENWAIDEDLEGEDRMEARWEREQDDEYMDAREARELMDEYHDRRMFDYKQYDEEHGMLIADVETAFAVFHSGEDYRAWERLQEMIKQNRESS